uniref:SprT-like domain-containing protein n=2 Tax=unclassified Prevotella TaxID=2638335 RepID=A0AB33JFA7_9BACT
MQVTVEWMGKWFDRFDRDYFGGGLPRPLLGISKSRTRLGTMSCKRATRWGKTRYYDFAIRLSNYYDQSEREYQNVLLHEMIHYSIAYTGLKDTAPHGVVFRGMMDALNRKYGWEIRVMSRRKEVAPRRIVAKERLVLAVELASGERVLSVVHPQYARRLDAVARRVRDFSNYGWYTSADAYFQDFPQVRSLRGRRVDRDTYENKLAEMRQVVL